MGVSNLFAFITFLLISKVHLSLSKCLRPTTASGSISNSQYTKRYLECWKIIVPPNDYVQLNMEAFSSLRDCSYSSVEISIESKDEKYIFCPNEYDNWKPVTAYDDVVIMHKISAFKNVGSRFSMKYRRENSLCAQKNIFKCNDGVCIPQSQVCDGLKHCHDGDDEKGCETGVFAFSVVDDSRLNGTRWLKEKWSPSSGWQENTHRGIIALHLATQRNATGVDGKENMMVKQLEVQALASLVRDETDPLTANQLSMFVNAMIVSCQDSRNFYGFDLVKLLKEKTEASAVTTRPVAYLALCNAGETLQANETSDLGNVLNRDSYYPFFLEVQAVAVMVLSCIRSNQQDGFNSSILHTDYDQAVTKFKQLQLEDGSFGNIYTTAIVTQALLSAGQENSRDWKFNAAVHHLMKHLNSSSVDFLATYLMLPVFNGKSLADIGNINCSVGPQHKAQGDSASGVKNKLVSKMRVKYSLYIGDEKDVVHTISLWTPVNITVFETMQLAQEADSTYKFQWKKMGQKLYIYDIAGVINDFEDGLFWLLYVRINATLFAHVRKSPDRVFVPNGANIIMWYKKIRTSGF